MMIKFIYVLLIISINALVILRGINGQFIKIDGNDDDRSYSSSDMGSKSSLSLSHQTFTDQLSSYEPIVPSCGLLSKDYFPSLVDYGFEYFIDGGWNNTGNVIIHLKSTAVEEDLQIIAYEGIGLAIFTEKNRTLESHPFTTPNFSNPDINKIFQKLTFQFRYVVMQNSTGFDGSSSDSNSSGSSSGSNSSSNSDSSLTTGKGTSTGTSGTSELTATSISSATSPYSTGTGSGTGSGFTGDPIITAEQLSSTSSGSGSFSADTGNPQTGFFSSIPTSSLFTSGSIPSASASASSSSYNSSENSQTTGQDMDLYLQRKLDSKSLSKTLKSIESSDSESSASKSSDSKSSDSTSKSSSSDSSSNDGYNYLIVYFDGVEITRISNLTYKNQYTYSYQLESIDITQYADGATHNISFEYIGNTPHENHLIFLIDYVQVIPSTTNLIKQDIYVSDKIGDNINGDGSLEKPFCTVQRAIYSLTDGYSIYIISDNETSPEQDPFYLYNDNIYSYYMIESLGKNLTILPTGLIHDENLMLYSTVGNYTRSVMICDSPLCIVKNINITTLLTNSLFLLTEYSNLRLVNGSIWTDGYLLPKYSGVISSNKYTSIYISGMMMKGCSPTCVSSSGYTIEVYYSSMFMCHGWEYFSNRFYAGNLTVTDSSFKDGDIGFWSSLTSFDSVIADNCLIVNSQGLNEISFENGHLFSITNSKFINSKFSWLITSVEHILFENLTMTACSISDLAFFVMIDINVLNITNSVFTDYSENSLPYFVANNCNYTIIENTQFVNNTSPFLISQQSHIIINNGYFSMNNIKNGYVLSGQNGSYEINDVNFLSSSNPFISLFGSKLDISKGAFSNCDNYQPGSLNIFLLDTLKPSTMTNLSFFDTFNFGALKLVNIANMTITGISINGSLVSNLITLEDSTEVTFNDLKATFNFLSTYYPLISNNSNFTVSNSKFSANCHYFSINGGYFTFDHVEWDSVHAVNVHSLFVSNATGRFNDCLLTNSIPNSGIYVENSNITYNHTNFKYLSGYSLPLGEYESSNTTFTSCMFENNISGESTMKFNGGRTIMSNCSFFNHTSDQTSLFFSTAQVSFLMDGCSVEDSYSNLNAINVDFCGNFTVLRSGFIANEYGNLMFSVFDSNFTMDNSVFSDGATTNSFVESTTIIRNSIFHLDVISADLFSITRGTFTFNNVTASGIDSSHQASVIHGSWSYINIINSNITQVNMVAANGTFIYSDSCQVVIENSSISGAQSKFGTMYASENSTFTITNSQFQGCISSSGSVLFSYGTDIDIRDSLFIMNSLVNDTTPEYVTGSGGAFTLFNSSTINVRNSTFLYNSADYNGGVFYLSDDSTAHILTSAINFNGVYFGAGGVCYSDSKEACFFDTQTVIENNTAVYGNNVATGPVTLNLGLSTQNINTNTSFYIYLNLTDAYGQLVSILREPVSFNITIYRINGTDMEVYQVIEVIKTLQGFYQTSFTIDSPIGTILLFEPSSTLVGLNMISLNRTMGACSPGYQTLPESQQCIPCLPGTYGYDGKTCIDCDLTEVLCPGGDVMITKKGYWAYNATLPPELYTCDPDICLQGECREGNYGLLCSQCDEGYAKVKNFCEECKHNNIYLEVSIAVFLVLYLLFSTIFKVPSASILLNYLLIIQIIGIFSYNIQYLSIIPLFDFNVDFWPSTCINPVLHYLWKQFISLCIIFFIVLPISVKFTWGKWLLYRMLPNFKTMIVEMFDKSLLYSLISNLIVLYTPISFISLSLITCMNIGDTQYLSIDSSIQCYTKQHLPLLVVAYVLLIFVVVGLPVFILVQIRKRKRYFLKIFFDKYKPKYIWWELLLLFRSLSFVIVTVTVTFHMDAKGILTSSLGLFFASLNWVCKPYKNPHKTDLDTHLGVILCLSGLVVNSRAFGSTDIVGGVIISLSMLFCLIPIIICIYCIYFKKDNEHALLKKNQTPLLNDYN